MIVILAIGILIDSLVFGMIERRIREKRGLVDRLSPRTLVRGQCGTSASGSSSSARTSGRDLARDDVRDRDPLQDAPQPDAGREPDVAQGASRSRGR